MKSRKQLVRIARWALLGLIGTMITLPPWRPIAYASGPTTVPSGQTITPGDGRVHSILELGNFPYDTDGGSKIPDRVKALDGATIRLRGFMIPAEQSTKVNKFLLVPSLFSCCYGKPPTVEHIVLASCLPGQTVEFSPEEVVVEGKLSVKELREDSYIVSIFQMTCTSATVALPLPKLAPGTGQLGNPLQ